MTTIRTIISRPLLWFALLMAGSSASSLAAQAPDLVLNVGQQQVYSHTRNLQRVAVADPGVASVTLTSAKSMFIQGKGPGETEISLWENGKSPQPTKVLHVKVNRPVNLEQQALKTAEVEALEPKAAGKSIALTGGANSLQSHDLGVQSVLQDPARPIDASNSNFDSHVQIDIKVVEVSRQNMMRFGLFLGRNGGSSNAAIAVGAPNTLSGIETNGSGFTFNSNSGFLPVLDAFNLALGNRGSGLLGTLSILESNGFAYTLAEPSLSAISGQTATFLAGGEYPVPIRTGSGSDSAITIQYKEYGVRLTLTPTVLDNDRIYLKVSPEVSELDFSNAVQTGGVSVPGLTVRRTDTSVSLGDGESFVISGLVSRNTLNNVDKLPWLGNIPIIGAFFSSKRFDRTDKELLMVVTPRLVRPIARTATLPELPGKEFHDYNPSFSEFFFSNQGDPSAARTGMSR